VRVVAVTAALGEVDHFNTAAIVTAILSFGIASAIWWTHFETVRRRRCHERLGAAFLWGYASSSRSRIAARRSAPELAIVAAAEDEVF
jgi:hypothetical protein